MENRRLITLEGQDYSLESLSAARRMPESLQALLNEQFIRELESSDLYLSLCNYFEAVGLSGFAHWMRLQAKEEQEHAMKIFDFMHERGVDVELAALAKPESTFSSPIDAMEQGLAQEHGNSLAIKGIYGAAQKAEEFDLVNFMNWFLEEQVEEEDSLLRVITDMKRAAADTTALLFLDRELAKRA
jgi:ferritin